MKHINVLLSLFALNVAVWSSVYFLNVREEKLKNETSLDQLKENTRNLQMLVTSLTLTQHIYLLEGNNFKNKNLRLALEEAVVNKNFKKADSLLNLTKDLAAAANK